VDFVHGIVAANRINTNTKGSVYCWRTEISFSRTVLWTGSMVYEGLSVDHCLEGASNCISWKGRIMIVLEDNGLGDFVKQAVPVP